MGAVKALAATGSSLGGGGRELLASSSIDETVRVYDLDRSKELVTLTEHTNTVTAVDWYRSSHLLSADLDGAICIWRTSDWTCLLKLRHVGGVSCLAVHPSGRLAFTIGVDTTYRLWDIVKGNVALQRKLGFRVNKVAWAPNGERFLLVADNHVQIRSLVDDNFICDVPHDNTVSDAVFVGNTHVATSESASLTIRIWPIVEGISQTHCHLAAPGKRRVRAMVHRSENGTGWLISVSSGGFVGVWNAAQLLRGDAATKESDSGHAPVETASAKGAGLSFRATCIALSTATRDDNGVAEEAAATTTASDARAAGEREDAGGSETTTKRKKKKKKKKKQKTSTTSHT